MSEPKTFTGPAGYTFRLEGGNVFIGQLSGPHPAGVVVPLSELRAFVSANAVAVYSSETAPAELKTFTGADGTIVQYNSAICEVVAAGSFSGSREQFEQNLYDTAPCLVCGGPRHSHDGPGQNHAFESR